MSIDENNSINPETDSEKAESATSAESETVDTEIEETADAVAVDDASEATSSDAERKVPFFQIAFEYIEMFSMALCVVMIAFMFVFRLCDVKGESMEQTLYEGEKLVVSNLFYTPSRGDIVIFHQTGYFNEPIVKRVIATGGETVDIETYKDGSNEKFLIKIYDKKGQLIEELDESAYAYWDPSRTLFFEDQYPLYVPEGYVFVLGDNRDNSADSRSDLIGLVDERRILGKVVFRIFPWNRAGSVN